MIRIKRLPKLIANIDLKVDTKAVSLSFLICLVPRSDSGYFLFDTFHSFGDMLMVLYYKARLGLVGPTL